VQASLFGPQEVPKATPAQPDQRRTTRRPQTISAKPKQAIAQQTLDFEMPLSLPASHTLQTSVEAAIYCDAPVAHAILRSIAGALDAGVSFIAVALFLATVQFGGYEITFDKHSIPMYFGMVFLISVFYRVLFCIGNGDTPGMQLLGLQLVNFDGHEPTRKQRIYRLLGGMVSAVAAGLGLIWALVDEERLAWHDHMSKTFPTFQAALDRRS
jgi:uncharacterized RDD family membrane protein YckC